MAVADTARLIASLELKDLFSKQIGNAEKSLGKFDTKLDQTQSRAYRFGQQIGNGIKNTTKIVASFVAAGATITAGVVAKGIAAASDLNETVSKVGVVFKKQAGSVLSFGKTSAAALGLSENAALSAAATYGNLFVSMGLASDKSADMSIKLVKLAGDLASFNNIDPDEALEKLRAGLTGESEPLKTLGININEQTLKAEALRLGLVKLTKGQKTYTAVLDPATKAQAAYSLIFKQSKTAQGDFARTSGGLANQVRILKANFTDMLATIGTPVLPAVAKIFQRINTLIKENQPQVAKFGDAVAGLFSDENINKGFELLKGAVETFKTAAPILEQSAKATFGFIQAGVNVFKSLPAPLQGLLVGGVALNKITGGILTNVAGGIVDLIGKSRGASPANPVFVSDVTGGLAGAAAGGGKLAALGGLLTKLLGVGLIAGGAVGIGAGVGIGGPGGAGLGALGGASAIGGGALLAGPAGAIIAAIAAVGKTALDIRQQSADQGNDIAASIQKQIAGGAKLSDLKTSLAAVNTGINDIQANPINVLLAGDALDQLRAQRELLEKQVQAQAIVNAPAGNATPKTFFNELAGKAKDDIVNLSRLNRAAILDALARLPDAIRKANSAKDIAKSVKDAVHLLVDRKQGNLADTEKTLAELRDKLKKEPHDSKTAAILRAAIHEVQTKLPPRQLAVTAVAKADAILKSNRSANDKIKALQSIENDLKNHKLPGAIKKVEDKLAAVKRAQVEAQHAITQSIKDKDMTPVVNVPITANSYITTNGITSAFRFAASLGSGRRTPT